MHRIKKDAIFLIDGSSFLYRAFYALRPMHTSKGVTVQAVYGFCRILKKIIDDFSPSMIGLVWDTKGKTFRTDIYSEYKATRQVVPSDLILQKELIMKFADIINLKQILQVGFEADDLIASIAAHNKDHQVIVISPDKDLQQMIDNRVLVFDPFKKIIIDEETFIKSNEFSSDRLVLFHSLLGDASDNIPGVSGIGKKTAQELASSFKSLDDLFENIDKVKSERIKKLLLEQKEQAYLSLSLFTLKIINLDLNEKDLLFNKVDWNNAYDFFADLEFNSLLKDIEPPKKQEKDFGDGQLSIFGDQSKKNIDYDWELIIIRNIEQLNDLVTQLKKVDIFAYDTETTGLRSLQDDLVGISIAFDNKKSFYIPIEVFSEQAFLKRDVVLNTLKPFIESEKIKKTMHNAKFDELVLWQYGIETKGVVFDSIIAAGVLRREGRKINLKVLSLQYLNEPMTSFAEVLGKTYKNFLDVPIDIAARYGAHDSIQTFKLKAVLEEELKKEKSLEKLFYEIEMPLSNVLFKMERTGIELDLTVIQETLKELDKELGILQRKILANIEESKSSQVDINLNSPKQVETLLFDYLKLPVVKKGTEGRRSTDQEVLEKLREIHPIPGLILRYRELFKLKSSYLEPLPEFINPKTGRVHTNYNQTEVATGRLSSNNPNLQNIPTDENYGMKIRSAFRAGRGKMLLSADYSQIDLRVLAHLTQDNALKNAFLEGRDIHTQTAAQIFEIKEDEVSSKQRQIGKRINFSIIYGLTPYGLSKDLGIKPSEAKIYIEKYFQQYPSVATWMDQVVEEGKKNGYVETLFGKRRYLSELHEKNKMIFEAARRVAINTPVQGTSAEIIKLAMIKIDKKFERLNSGAAMLLQIHDELIIEFDSKEEEVVSGIVRNCMEKIVDWDIPLNVAIRCGKTWKDISK